MTDDPYDRLLGALGPDPGCDICLSQLAAWADQMQAGLDASAAFPEIARHLRNCPACREDAEALLALLKLPDLTGETEAT